MEGGRSARARRSRRFDPLPHKNHIPPRTHIPPQPLQPAKTQPTTPPIPHRSHTPLLLIAVRDARAFVLPSATDANAPELVAAGLEVAADAVGVVGGGGGDGLAAGGGAGYVSEVALSGFGRGSWGGGDGRRQRDRAGGECTRHRRGRFGNIPLRHAQESDVRPLLSTTTITAEILRKHVLPPRELTVPLRPARGAFAPVVLVAFGDAGEGREPALDGVGGAAVEFGGAGEGVGSVGRGGVGLGVAGGAG